MRNWKRRLLAGVMAAALLTGLLPAALAAENEKITTPLDFTNVGDDAGQTPASGSGYNWSGDAENGYTLELNGLDLETPTDSDLYYAIYFPETDSDINIIVTGENQIKAPDSTLGSVSGIYYHGTGEVTITGGGTLKIEATGSAIVQFSNLTVNNVTLSAKCEQGGIQVNSGNISITDSTITADSQGYSAAAVNAYAGALTITDSKLNITTGATNGLNAKTTLTISGGNAIVTNNDGNRGTPAIISNGDVIITNGAEVTAVNERDGERSYAICSKNLLSLGENVRVSASADTKSVMSAGDFTMADTATLILPASTTAEQLASMKVPATNKLILGDLPAKWDGCELSFALESIAVKKQPTKIAYTFGETFDATGMVVTATYADGSSKDITENVVYSNALSMGQTSVELSYIENGVTKTCSVSGITVGKKTSSSYNTNSSVTYNNQAKQIVDLSGFIPADSGAVKSITAVATDGSNVIASSSGDAGAKAAYYTLAELTTGGQTATLTATIVTENYENITVTITIEVSNKSTPTGEPVLSASTITYGDKLSTIGLSGSMSDGAVDVPGTFAWDDPDTMPDAGDYSAAWTFTSVEGDRYEIAKGTASITVNKATPTGRPQYTAISGSGKTLIDAGLTTEDGTFSVPGTVAWKLADTTAVEANTSYEWVFTPDDSNNYNTLSGSIELWHRSSSGGGGGSSSGNTTTETTKNDDGSTTTTVTNKTTGTVTETTKHTDGSTTAVETKKDGTVTTTEKAADGSTAVVTTDKNGRTEAQVSLSEKAVDAAQGEAVALPIPPVTASRDNEDAPVVEVSLPRGSDSARVEIPVEDVTPGTVAVRVKADGTEEVIKTSLTTGNGVAVTLGDGDTVKIVDNSKDFDDTRDHWAEDAVVFAASRELFAGTTETTFTPDSPMTRAMLMTVLARFDGEDTTGGSVWYEKGMAWAVANGVSDGSNPDGSITREQFATMLWRYAGSPAVDDVIDHFSDADKVSSYATDAMRWAVSTGIIGGMGDGTLAPQGSATRAQVATMLMRFVENLTR